MFDNLNQNNNSQDNNKNSNERPKDLNKSLNADKEQTVNPSERAVDKENKGKIEDIFSETDKISPLSKVKKEESPIGSNMEIKEEKKEKLTKILVLIGFIIGLIVIIGGSYILIGRLFDNSSIDSENNNVIPINNKTEDNKTEDNKTEDNVQKVNDNTIKTLDSVEASKKNNEKNEQSDDNVIKKEAAKIENVIIDSDKDGLSDEAELKIGTDINNVDSDNDGLFDREEVKVYLTDPLDSDTDKDGFLDGAEVENAYNPNGPGKLYDINNNNI